MREYLQGFEVYTNDSCLILNKTFNVFNIFCTQINRCRIFDNILNKNI